MSQKAIRYISAWRKDIADVRGSGRPVHNVDQVDNTDQHRQEAGDDDDKYIFSVNTMHDNQKPIFLVKINGTPVKMLGDTGAPLNIISEKAFNQISPLPPLHNADTKLFAYGPSTKALPIIGMFDATLSSNYATVTAKVYVTDGQDCALLSRMSSEALKLITVHHEAVIAEVKPQPLKVKHLQDCFTGMEKLKDVQIKLHIDHTVRPVAQQHRRIPFHLRDKVEAEIKCLEEQDIVEEVEGPTPWVSPIVVAPKPKDPKAVRLCVDMRMANQAILQERHLTPTVDDIIHDLNGASVFSKLDLNQGYHQLELDPESRYITTFTTHLGLRRYKRLNFGISSAAEVFQNAIQTALSGLTGVCNM